MSYIGNLVQQTTTGTGSGNLPLVSVAGKRNFYTEFSGASFYYFISHRTKSEWEVGVGHMADATTLVRDAVIQSSNANSKVVFSSDTKDVVNDLPASIQAALETLTTDYIRTDGTSSTTNEIPFNYGLKSYADVLIDSTTSGGRFLLRAQDQSFSMDDGVNQINIIPYDSGSSGMVIDAVGKCKIDVDGTNNMLFTAGAAEFNQPTAINNTLSVTGSCSVQAGLSNTFANVGGVTAHSVTQTTSSTTGAVDLWNVTVPGGTLTNLGDSISFDFHVSAANNANNKQFTVTWGGTTIGDSTNTAAQNGGAHVSGIIIRVNSTTCYCSVMCNSITKWSNFTTYTSVTATLSSSQALKVVASAAIANGDITFRLGKVRYEPKSF